MAEVLEVGTCCVSSCQAMIYNIDRYYKCDGVCQAIMCHDCLCSEEGHQHPMRKVAPERIALEQVYFAYDDPITGNTLYLGEYCCAIPGSKTIEANAINSVLTIMEFDDPNLPGIKDLRKVYHTPNYSPNGAFSGVLYHNVAIPDFRDPKQLRHTDLTLPNLLCRTTTFIEERLHHGNVLLHCQLGQRRSPTMLIAWLVSRKFSVNRAIDFIDRNYTGIQRWGAGYRKERAKWISKLNIFQQKYKPMLKFWKRKNAEILDEWAALGVTSETNAYNPNSADASANSNGDASKISTSRTNSGSSRGRKAASLADLRGDSEDDDDDSFVHDSEEGDEPISDDAEQEAIIPAKAAQMEKKKSRSFLGTGESDRSGSATNAKQKKRMVLDEEEEDSERMDIIVTNVDQSDEDGDDFDLTSALSKQKQQATASGEAEKKEEVLDITFSSESDEEPAENTTTASSTAKPAASESNNNNNSTANQFVRMPVKIVSSSSSSSPPNSPTGELHFELPVNQGDGAKLSASVEIIAKTPTASPKSTPPSASTPKTASPTKRKPTTPTPPAKSAKSPPGKKASAKEQKEASAAKNAPKIDNFFAKRQRDGEGGTSDDTLKKKKKNG